MIDTTIETGENMEFRTSATRKNLSFRRLYSPFFKNSTNILGNLDIENIGYITMDLFITFINLTQI